MKNLETVKYALKALENSGAQKAQCEGVFSTTWDLTALSGKIELLRTVNDETSIAMKGYFDGKMGAASISSGDRQTVDGAAVQCLENSKGGKADDTVSFNESAEKASFGKAFREPQLKKLIERTEEFLKNAKERHPNVHIRQLVMLYTQEERVYCNSFGAELSESDDFYSMSIMFSGFEGDKNSSFNTYNMSFKDLDTPFIELGLVDKRLGQAAHMVNTEKSGKKTVGVMLVAPHCLRDFLGQLINAYASSSALIGGNSRWQNAVGSKVACDSLTLKSCPADENMAYNTMFTDDGFVCEEQTIIEKGVLKSLMPDMYTSQKTGIDRRKSAGGYFTVEAGDTSFEDILSSIEEGILINRYSGGNAGASGELSGIAKNSFYIKNGKIAGAARETVISANLSDMLMNIKAISKEKVNDGGSELPYIAFDNVTII